MNPFEFVIAIIVITGIFSLMLAAPQWLSSAIAGSGPVNED